MVCAVQRFAAWPAAAPAARQEFHAGCFLSHFRHHPSCILHDGELSCFYEEPGAPDALMGIDKTLVPAFCLGIAMSRQKLGFLPRWRRVTAST